jgi:hypothetical protein
MHTICCPVVDVILNVGGVPGRGYFKAFETRLSRI